MAPTKVLPANADVVLVVAHADRGHFNWCLPLARELKMLGLKAELWTNSLCESWLTPDAQFESVQASRFGDGRILNKFVGLYKAAVSEGDSDQEGMRAVCGGGMGGVGDIAHQAGLGQSPDAFAMMPTGGAGGQKVFRERVDQPDVAFICWECTWGHWAGQVAAEARKLHSGFKPSFLEPYRAAYQTEPLPLFDGVERVRNTKADIVDSHTLRDLSGKQAFILARCLQGRAKNTGGCARYGAFLPTEVDASITDVDLEEWLNRDGKVTVVSLGSQSTLRTLSAWAEASLLKGCLRASPRVLTSSPGVPEDLALQRAVADGVLKACEWLPLWAVLGHTNTACFVSHCGANSVHEALAQGTAIVPLPFFDDQLYIAPIVEGLMGYVGHSGFVPLRKALLRSSEDAGAAASEAAVRLGLEVPHQTLQRLKEEVRAEDGARTAARAIKARISASPKLRKPEFRKVASISPSGDSSNGLNLMMRVVSRSQMDSESGRAWSVVAGDATGIVTLLVREEAQASICEPGASIRVQNARVVMTTTIPDGALSVIRLVVDKWGVLRAAGGALLFEANERHDISATEYELAP